MKSFQSQTEEECVSHPTDPAVFGSVRGVTGQSSRPRLGHIPSSSEEAPTNPGVGAKKSAGCAPSPQAFAIGHEAAGLEALLAESQP